MFFEKNIGICPSGIGKSLVMTLFYLCYRYFNKPVNVFCEFIPEVIFMLAIFGYLIIMIFYKWILWNPSDTSCAPSLLIRQ